MYSMNRNQKFVIILIIALFSLSLVQCTSAPDVEEPELPDEAAITTQEVDEAAPDGAFPPPQFEDQSWANIVASASGQTINWHMWGGSDAINDWVEGYIADQMKERYDITVNMVPQDDIAVAVNMVRDEMQANPSDEGSVDLLWINGENYRMMREEGLLYGPWSQYLPSSVYVNWEDGSVANDFGYPVEGYESPYGKAQMVMIYDEANVPQPPTTIDDLIAWIKDNPGKFSYPALPDFNGSAFIRHICYWAADGHESFLGEFDQAVFDEKLTACYDQLNEIEPYLWNEGKSYPESATALEELFINGDVYFNMNYQITQASVQIENGNYPDTVRTYVFEGGTLANTHYVSIPANASHKAAAMVLANLLLSPEVQEDKWNAWGDTPVLDPVLLSVEWRQKFNDLPRGVATLPIGILAEHRLPEPRSEWVGAIEAGWVEEVQNN